MNLSVIVSIGVEYLVLFSFESSFNHVSVNLDSM